MPRVKTVLPRGSASLSKWWEMPVGATVEILQQMLADVQWGWRRSDEAVPGAYVIMLPEHEQALLPGTVLVDAGTYNVRISMKEKGTAGGNKTQGAEKEPKEGAPKGKLGRPALALPIWMGEGGRIESMTEFEAGEKLLVRLATAKSRASKEQDDAEVLRIATLQASAKEHLQQFKAANKGLFKQQARSKRYKLAAKFDRLGAEYFKEMARLERHAFHDGDDELEENEDDDDLDEENAGTPAKRSKKQPKD